MGKVRVSVKTLPDGTKVRHHPPDRWHPKGKLELLEKQGTSLRERILSVRDHLSSEHDRRHEDHRRRVAHKKALESKGNLPPEKSPF